MLGDLGSLASAVIYQAWSDAGAGIVRGTRRAENDRERHEAVRFLTADHGPWAQSRKHWAEIAGVCPDQLRQRALVALATKMPAEQPAMPTRLPRPGTKLAALLELLQRPEGISLDDMQARFEWSRTTCSTAISGDLPSKFGLRSQRGDYGRYRLIEAL